MLAFVLLLIAVILLIMAAIPLSSPPKWNLMALGLAFFAGSFLVQTYPG